MFTIEPDNDGFQRELEPQGNANTTSKQCMSSLALQLGKSTGILKKPQSESSETENPKMSGRSAPMFKGGRHFRTAQAKIHQEMTNKYRREDR
jgi:hypothetical protein